MPSIGYPDWERVQREGGDLVIFSNVIIAAPLELGPVNVQQWKSARLQVNSATGSDDQTIVVSWYDTILKSNLLSSQPLTVQHGASFGIAIPMQGPYLDVVITPRTGGAISPFKISITGLRTVPSNYQMFPMSVPLIADSSAYTANQAKLLVPSVYYGNAVFSVMPQLAATARVHIDRFDLATNLFVPIYDWSSILQTAPLIVQLSLPLSKLNVTVDNGATAQTITTTLMPAP